MDAHYVRGSFTKTMRDLSFILPEKFTVFLNPTDGPTFNYIFIIVE